MAATKNSNPPGPRPSPAAQSMVSDPGLGASVDTGPVDAASPTHAPNRVTVHVPTDTTALSLGAGNPTPWKTDLGIVGYSAQHIHFETKQNDPTIVSLGGPATTASISGHDGKPPTKSSGYSMVTSKNAWHEAQLQHYLLSRESDISIRAIAGAKRAVVQADKGFVDLNGGEEVNVAAGGVAIGASTAITLVPIKYTQNCGDVHNDSTFAATAKLYADRINMILPTFDLYTKAQKLWPKLAWNKMKGDPSAWVDPVKWALDSAKWLISGAKALNLHHDTKGAPTGSVKIAAQKTVAALAGEDISLNGTKAASMGGGAAVSVSATAIATLKGAAWAGVGSMLTAVRGRRRLEISSPWGEINFGAKKNVELTADAELSAAAKKNASIAAGKHLLFGAEKRTFIGVAEGGGYGFLLDKEGIAFGKATDVTDMTKATIEATPAIRIDADKIAIALSSDTSVTVGSTISMKSKTITFQATNNDATFKGSLVKLGC